MSLTPKPFHELLKMHFIIPPYQRGYRWEARQIEELLNDLLEFVKSLMKRKSKAKGNDKEPYYCLQPIALVKVSEKQDTYIVVDGQQRLTTIYLLLHYLYKTREYDYTIYTLSMPSRDKQELYLSKKGYENEGVKYTDNIDNFYIRKAYESIIDWFARDQHDRFKSKIRDLFVQEFDDMDLNDVRVIWYEIPEIESHRAFRELNYGKIPLTSTELVKALLLQTKNNIASGSHNLGTSYRRALEWDSMEHALQNPYLWSMLVSSGDKTLSHLELILDFVADQLNQEMADETGKKPIERKDKSELRDDFNYQVINEYIRRQENLTKVIDDIWKRIQIIFNLIINWYSNREWYHLIGLIRILQNKKRREFVEFIYKMAIDDNGNPVDRPIFTNALERTVGNLIRLDKKLELNALKYDENNQEIIKILKMFNVYESINNKTEENRFAFHLFETFNVTSLEHIHPQNIVTMDKYTDFKTWFEHRREDFNKIDKSSIRVMVIEKYKLSEDEENHINELCSTEYTNVIKAIESLEELVTNKNSFEKEENKSEIEKNAEILDHFFGDLSGITQEELHSIKNLALVDGPTNSALQNYFLDRKREILMHYHNICDIHDPNNMKGTYAPPATRNVFCKEYSRENPGDMRLWRPEDRNAYFKNLKKAYDYYITK